MYVKEGAIYGTCMVDKITAQEVLKASLFCHGPSIQGAQSFSGR